MERPVLDAIRATLKFKDSATISEIAKYAGLTHKQVLDTINANGSMVWRNRKTGHVTKVDPRGVLRKQLVESDAYYFPDTYGAWSVEGHSLRFKGHDDLRARLRESRLVGGIGDCWTIEPVIDTPENRAALEADGLKLWSEDEADERLWVETARAAAQEKGGG
ncbi:hypothetical protein [Paracoccus sp. IB05]|uniref:hypothetical protein n=1 Tax=Paracoccus sp. IB05 TaxID=2779367 RepID=UPI0018E8322B|nr:hypothetical protein [Paracoccus sp. IB05]MBJ2150938.1 hypothetical protein [Paracoccus sp. IB05]